MARLANLHERNPGLSHPRIACGRLWRPVTRLLRQLMAHARPPACRALRSTPGRSTRSPTAISTSSDKPPGLPTGWCSRSACIPARRRCFPAEQRLEMLQETCGPVVREAGCELKCVTFADLVVTAAQREGATLLIRGLRDGTDFDYEMQMAGMNAAMAPGVQTVFLPASPRCARSPPHWCGRSRPWAATLRRLCRRRLQPVSNRNSPARPADPRSHL